MKQPRYLGYTKVVIVFPLRCFTEQPSSHQPQRRWPLVRGAGYQSTRFIRQVLSNGNSPRTVSVSRLPSAVDATTLPPDEPDILDSGMIAWFLFVSFRNQSRALRLVGGQSKHSKTLLSDTYEPSNALLYTSDDR